MSKLFNTSLNRIVGNTVKRFQRKTNKIRPPSDGLLASGFALFLQVFQSPLLDLQTLMSNCLDGGPFHR